MRIVSADPSFGDMGFGKAVQISKKDAESPQAIIDFALSEGKGKPINDGEEGEMILIQLGENGDQHACPLSPKKNALKLKEFLKSLF